MPVTYLSGDPLLTRAQILAVGHNARGRAELGALETLLFTRQPAAFASYSKHCRSGRITAGQLWIWRESQPMLAFLAVRASAVGATRVRYVESIALTLARDYQRDGIRSIALAPLGSREEWPYLKPVLDRWLSRSALPCIVYEQYLPGVQAEPDNF
ncbi:MAG: hypothetical protein K8J31_11470 [Anaerolineae bacterium]|nr:hypothetical protein [Anaerolineae bacterium]